MPITAAEIEPNGWVLKLTLSGATLGTFASYVFDTDIGQTPRVTLTSSHAGFTPSAGVAIAGTFTRSLYGAYAVRKPMAIVDPAPKLVDETDLGGGVITCRIALHEWIYATDTGLSLAVLAGWRSGHGAQSAIAVTNNSAAVAPMPIFRWALVPYDIATGSFRLSLIVASHHPLGFQPVAGVKFTVTDGVNTKTVWTTALSTDNSYGDKLRCHSVIVDPATATALTEGLLRCDAEVYPFLGNMRSTDAAGSRSMTGLGTAGYNLGADVPFVIGYDPAGTRYGNFAYIDYINGSATAAAGMIQNTLALAKAVSAASRPKDISVAIQALRMKGRSLANAGRGGSAVTNSIDGLQCVLAPQIHAGAFGTLAVGSPANLSEIPVFLVGDPDDSNPRANCIVRTQATVSNSRAGRIRMRNMTLETGYALGGGISSFVGDGVTIRAQTGMETSTQAPWSISPTAGTWNFAFTNSRFWRHSYNMKGQNNGLKSGLYRACEMSRPLSGTTFLRNRWITLQEDGVITGNTIEGFAPIVTTAAGDIGGVEDVFVAFNDLRGVYQAVWAPGGSVPANTVSGTTYQSIRRHVLLNNVIEGRYYAADPSRELFNYGEAQQRTISYLIVEGNTVAGGGYNAFYCQPGGSTLAEGNTLNSEAFFIRHANNATDRNASKHDDFNYPGLAALRGGGSANGYRPQLVNGWAGHMGVGMEGHVDFSRAGSYTNFRRDSAGLRGIQYADPTTPGYKNDASAAGSDAGLGDYTPIAGSPLLGRIIRANSDQDFAGNARKANGASGAFEYIASGIEVGGAIAAAAVVVAGVAQSATPAASLVVDGAVAAGRRVGAAIVASLVADAAAAAARRAAAAITATVAVDGVVGMGADPSARVAASFGVGAIVAAGARLGAAGASAVVLAAAVNAAIIPGSNAEFGNEWSIRFGANVQLGSPDPLASLLAADTAASAVATARLRVGAALAANAVTVPLLRAGLDVGIGADCIVTNSATAALLTGMLLAATPTAASIAAAALKTGAGLFAAATPSLLITATLETAWPTSASALGTAQAGAALLTGKTLGAQAIARPLVFALLVTRQHFPVEPRPGSDRPRATQGETLDALIWRVTGMTSIEAVLAANPGLADLGTHLPQGQQVDLGTATAETDAPVRDLVQLWD